MILRVIINIESVGKCQPSDFIVGTDVIGRAACITQRLRQFFEATAHSTRIRVRNGAVRAAAFRGYDGLGWRPDPLISGPFTIALLRAAAAVHRSYAIAMGSSARIAAPMWAGLAKVVAQRTGGRLGNMNPRIYTLGAMHDASSSGLRDVTSGNNSYHGVAGFAAVAGYDRATGWGSADMAAFAAAYPASPAAPTPTAGPATVTPKRILFGRHKVGAVSATSLVTIANPLSTQLVIVISSVNLIGSNFVVDSSTTTCSGGVSLARGNRCRIGLRFAPAVLGPLSATVSITDNSSNSPHLVKVYGTGM
jgi:hypothetical protein